MPLTTEKLSVKDCVFMSVCLSVSSRYKSGRNKIKKKKRKEIKWEVENHIHQPDIHGAII